MESGGEEEAEIKQNQTTKMEFFIVDATYNEDTLYVNAKTEELRSVKLYISHVPELVYLTPNDGCSKEAVVEELKNRGIDEFEWVTMSNVIIPTLPKTRDIELLRVSRRVDGETFKCTHQSDLNPIERFSISHGIKGPCWVRVTNVTQVHLSRYTVDHRQASIRVVTEKPSLPVTVLCISDHVGLVFTYPQTTEDQYVVKPRNQLLSLENIDIVCGYDTTFPREARLFVDLLVHAREHYPRLTDYSLRSVGDAMGIVPQNTEDVFLMKQIMLKMDVMQSSFDMAVTTGSPWRHSLRSEGMLVLVEWTMLHAFYERNILIPNKQTRQSVSFAGGLVLEPKKGIYTNLVMLFDFRSLYPSVIREYSLCFSPHVATVLPELAGQLVELRRQSTGVRQKSLKLVVNSLYGCLASLYCRFYDPELASTITARGRSVLQDTVRLLEEYRVIYGDTDSVMVDMATSDINEAVAMSQRIVEMVNSKYRFIELRLDATFKELFLVRKKKYAGIKNDSLVRDVKGMVTNLYCKASQKIESEVIDMILGQGEFPAKDEVDSVVKKMSRELADLVVIKQMAKRLNEYHPESAPDHVKVAMRMRTARKGDNIPMVKCTKLQDGVGGWYHPDEVIQEGLTVDYAWSLDHQVYPVVNSLLSWKQEVQRIPHCTKCGEEISLEGCESCEEELKEALPLVVDYLVAAYKDPHLQDRAKGYFPLSTRWIGDGSFSTQFV